MAKYAKILLGLTIAIIIGTGWLGVETRKKTDALQGDLKSTKEDLAQTKATLKKTQQELKETQDNLAQALATIEERNKEIAKQKSEIGDLTDKLAKTTTELETKTAELAKVNDDLSKMKEKLGTINPEEMVAKLNLLNSDLEKARTEIAEGKQVIATLEQQKKDTEDRLTSTQRVVDEYKQGFVRNGLTGKIAAYDPGWNFVVLNIGDKQGIKVNAQMIVLRGNEQVAKVKVSKVEPTQSIADVVKGTMVRPLQAGDTVVFEDKR